MKKKHDFSYGGSEGLYDEDDAVSAIAAAKKIISYVVKNVYTNRT